MSQRLKGKVALITGGAAGCGLAASELFAHEGAKVAIIDLPQSKGEEVARGLKDKGLDVAFFPADVSSSEQVNRAVREIENKFGLITILLNHAGI